MTHFKVVLTGRARANGERPPAPALDGLQAYVVVSEWFLPEPVVVRLHRSRRRVELPRGWELSLHDPLAGLGRRSRVLDRAALVTMAAAGMVAAVMGTAQAEEAASGAATPVCVESSSVPNFVPTDHPPRVVFVREDQEGRLDLAALEPLLDVHGNPILIAAYHSNSAGTPHTNVASTPHSNAAWSNHSNQPAGHTDTSWSNLAPVQSIHTNIVPGDFVF